MAEIDLADNLAETQRVVIIDSNADDRAHICQMLQEASARHWVFEEAHTGAQGVAAIRNATALPNWILLGSNLADMTALEVIAALLDTDGMPVCPIVVVTGAESEEVGRSVLRAGAQDYVSKDWINGHVLNRALENASESWAIARELRQRKDALRVVTERDTFRGLFRDATHDLTDEHNLMRIASLMLGRHFVANRVVYGEVLDNDTLVVGSSFVDGVKQIEGMHKLQDYGPKLLATFQSGNNIVVSDIQTDSQYSDSEKAAYAAVEVVANLGIPILKNGQLVAVMGIHQNVPRQWSHEEIATAREIAERTWSAVEHARTEKNLRAQELQFSQMLHIMPSFSAVLTGPSFVFQMANQSYFDLVGRGPEIIGKTLVEALPEIADQPFPALLDEVYRTGKLFEARAMLVKLPRGPAGSLIDIFVDFSYLPLRGANGEVSDIFVHGVDRTVEVQATQMLAQNARELRSLTNNTPDVLTRFDRQLRHVFVNSVIEKITGRKVEELLGKSNREIGMPEHMCDLWDAAINYVFEHGADTSLDFEWETPHDGVHYYSCRLVPEFSESGSVDHVLGVTHDITQRKVFEQQLSDQARRKDEFLATLAHELRNPLAPIRTGLQVLKLAQNSPHAEQILPVMERQIGHMVRLIDDLLDVSRINSGKIVLRQECVALHAVVASAVEASTPLMEAAHHTLKVSLPDTAIWLNADSTRLAQVFSNLLNNAAKYTPKGGQICLNAHLRGDQVELCVSDNGMGIPAGMLSGVFDMFTQINRTLDRAEGGLGLGLSLVKTLVHLHGGTVRADSPGIDQGSEFTVSLPVVLPPALQPGSHTTPRTNATVTHRRILVVDDNVDAAQTLAMLLDFSGHTTQSVFSGQQALDTALSFHPEIIFLDIGLPDMTGYEVARRLLANPATSSSYLIALTGWGTEDDVRKSKTAGFYAHLTKPVDPDAVESILSTLPAAAVAMPAGATPISV